MGDVNVNQPGVTSQKSGKFLKPPASQEEPPGWGAGVQLHRKLELSGECVTSQEGDTASMGVTAPVPHHGGPQTCRGALVAAAWRSCSAGTALLCPRG